MAAYTDAHFGMFSGESSAVKLCFDKDLAGVAIDQFGSDAMLIPYDENHFSVTIQTAVNVQFFGWLSGLGEKVRILGPESAVREMRELLQKMMALYQ
jgi:hypothetical protein